MTGAAKKIAGLLVNVEIATLEKWREPVAMSDDGKKALANLGFGAAWMMGRGVPVNWEIAEIRKK